jgi:hypothetical protein
MYLSSETMLSGIYANYNISDDVAKAPGQKKQLLKSVQELLKTY